MPPKDRTSEFIAGLTAGALSTFLFAPVNIIQSRMQVGQHQRVRTPRDFVERLVEVYRDEGLQKMYEGCGPAVIGSALAWGIYHPAKSSVRGHLLTAERRIMGDPTRGLSSLSTFVATSIAGALTNTMMNPVFLVKTRLDIQRRTDSNAYRGPVDCVRRIVKDEGVLSLYRGLMMFQLGALGPGIRFTLYDKTLDRITTAQGYVTPRQRLAANMASKLVTTGAFYPCVVIRTRMRYSRDGRSVADHVKEIMQTDGPKGFYSGFGLHFMRSFPLAIVNLHVYGLIEAALRAGRQVV